MEAIVEKMQGENGGVSVRTVKAFMSKVPSVFTGADLISWILKNLDVEDVTDAIHLAHLLSSHGYLFPIDDHQLTVSSTRDPNESVQIHHIISQPLICM